MRFKESFTFLKRFAEQPRKIGSVTPSSKFLTKAMLERVDWDNANCIAELGAGTGVFTREIVKRAKPDAKILVFEIDPALQTPRTPRTDLAQRRAGTLQLHEEQRDRKTRFYNFELAFHCVASKDDSENTRRRDEVAEARRTFRGLSIFLDHETCLEEEVFAHKDAIRGVQHSACVRVRLLEVKNCNKKGSPLCKDFLS